MSAIFLLLFSYSLFFLTRDARAPDARRARACRGETISPPICAHSKTHLFFSHKQNARKKREEIKAREAAEAERKKKEEFESLPENKQKAIKAKEDGNAAYKAQELDKALDLYRQASEHDPESPVYLTNMAAVYMAQKNYEAVIESCEKVRGTGVRYSPCAKLLTIS